MIHYHGLPITPNSSAIKAVEGGHAFICHRHAEQLSIAQSICQSYAVDNGAFPAWRSGKPIRDWSAFADWVAPVSRHPGCDFVVVPDVIDGDEEENDALLAWWPLPHRVSAPVWHMHESLDRLFRLSEGNWNRVCIGSSAEYARVGTPEWWDRIDEALCTVCDTSGRPMCRLHGLRMLNPKVFTRLPLASADSTNIGRNIGLDVHWKGTYLPPNKDVRASVMRSRIESHNSSSCWISPTFVDPLI